MAQTHRHAGGTDYGAAVYGSILVTALVAALDHADAAPGSIGGSVTATMAVFWLAHVWSNWLGERVDTPRVPSLGRMRELSQEEWPMLQSAALPLLPLLLGAVDVLDPDLSIGLALGFGVAQLFAWGYFVGRRRGGSRTIALLTGLVDGTFGLAIVALEVLVH